MVFIQAPNASLSSDPPSNLKMASRFRAISLALLIFGCPIQALLGWGNALLHAQPGSHLPIAETDHIQVGASILQVDFAEGPFDLPKSAILARIATAASAVATYYGRFPRCHGAHPRHPRSRSPRRPSRNYMGRYAWLARIHAPPHRRAHHRSRACQRVDDHPRTHPHGFPSMPTDPDDLGRFPQHWIEEGLATYIEPDCARDGWRSRLRRADVGRHGARHASGRARARRPGPGPHAHLGPHLLGRSDVLPRRRCRDSPADSQPLRPSGCVASHRRRRRHHRPQLDATAGARDRRQSDRHTRPHRLYAQWKDKPVEYDLPALLRNSACALHPIASIRHHRSPRGYSRRNHPARAKPNHRNRRPIFAANFNSVNLMVSGPMVE